MATMLRSKRQCQARLDEIQAHGFIDRWVSSPSGVFLVYAPLPYGPYTLKEIRAWLDGVDAMGVGGTL